MNTYNPFKLTAQRKNALFGTVLLGYAELTQLREACVLAMTLV
jgi:hypothetical protein